MKKSVLLFIAIIGLGTSVHAQKTKPSFKFESDTHDFGRIAVNKPVTYDFSFVNVGDEPLIITKAEASCGCTVPKYTSQLVKKDEKGVISVTYSAAGAPSTFTKSITLTSNAKESVKVLYIKGETVNVAKSTP